MNNPAYLLKKYLEAKTERNEGIIFFSPKQKQSASTKSTKPSDPQNKIAKSTPDFFKITGTKQNTLIIIRSITAEDSTSTKSESLLLQKILQSVDIDHKNINILTINKEMIDPKNTHYKQAIIEAITPLSPKALCIMGDIPSLLLMGNNNADSLRQKAHIIANIKTIVTISPKQIIETEKQNSPEKTKAEKIKIWQDMKIIKKLLAL